MSSGWIIRSGSASALDVHIDMCAARLGGEGVSLELPMVQVAPDDREQQHREQDYGEEPEEQEADQLHAGVGCDCRCFRNPSTAAAAAAGREQARSLLPGATLAGHVVGLRPS